MTKRRYNPPNQPSESPYQGKFEMARRLLRAGRIFRGLTQAQIASALGVDQSIYSRMENGSHGINIEHWFSFCNLTQIPFDSVQYGCIDFLTPISITDGTMEGGFKIPREYSYFRASAVRSFTPALELFSHHLGDDQLNTFIKERKLDRDFFLLSSGTLNFNFTIDLFKALVKEHVLSRKNLIELRTLSKNTALHGRLKNEYDLVESPIDVIHKYIDTRKYYEKNFSYNVIAKSNTQVDLSVSPRAHLREFNFKNDPILQSAPCEYMKFYLEGLTHRPGHKRATLTERDCMYKPGTSDRCIYSIEL